MDDKIHMQEFYDKAKTTIEVLVANMVRPDIANHVLFTHYAEVTPTNVIKLLMRVRRLYDARNEAVNILKLVYEAESILLPKQDLWCIIQDNESDKISDAAYTVVRRTLEILSKALARITTF